MDFKQNKKFQNLVEIIAETNPDNVLLQEKLQTLATTKASFIKKIQLEWEERSKPDFNELDIRTLNIQYLAEQTRESFDVEERQGNFQTISAKEWILKEKCQWKGFDPETRTYYKKNIEFGGNLNFDENYLPLVILDKASGSINLIVTIRNFITKGSEMSLGTSDWISIFLILSQRFLPLVFSSLSRHSTNLEALFSELVATINSDHETSKLRSVLNHISRKPSDQIHPSLFRIKAVYAMILGITNPNLSDIACQIKADWIGVQCIPHLISKECNSAFQVFLQAKGIENEVCSVAESCNFIASQEYLGANFQLTQQVFLPKSCTILDMQSVEAKTLEQLVVNQTALDVNLTQPTRGRSGERKPNDRQMSRNSMERNLQQNWVQNKPPGAYPFPPVVRRSQSPRNLPFTRGQSPVRNNNQSRGREMQGAGMRSNSNERRVQRSPSPGRGQDRSTSRARGSPRRMQGCYRCGSKNHVADSCTRFSYWTGPKCRFCSYLHDAKLCPLFVKDEVIKKRFVSSGPANTQTSRPAYVPKPSYTPKKESENFRQNYQLEVESEQQQQQFVQDGQFVDNGGQLVNNGGQLVDNCGQLVNPVENGQFVNYTPRVPMPQGAQDNLFQKN